MRGSSRLEPCSCERRHTRACRPRRNSCGSCWRSAWPRIATRTRAQTNDLIAENRSSYARSRNLFIGVGAGSILLATLLGFVLSGSLVGPIQRTEARLAEIAEGDFSRRLEVANRDELGAL